MKKDYKQTPLGKVYQPVLARYFGDSPAARILDVLLSSSSHDDPMGEIYGVAGVSPSAARSAFEKLEREGIVVKSRRVGRAALYRLRADETVEALRRFAYLVKRDETKRARSARDGKKKDE